MEREQFRKEIIELERLFKSSGIEKPCFNKLIPLNRYFGNYAYPFGVDYINFIDYRGFKFEIVVSTPNNKTYKYHENDDLHTISEWQMDGIVSFLRDFLEKRKKEIADLYEKGKKELSIEEMLTKYNKIANETIKEIGKDKKYRTKLFFDKYGKGFLTIEYFGNEFGKIGFHYLSSFKFYKDKYGINHITYSYPLMGETNIDPNIENFKKYIISDCE